MQVYNCFWCNAKLSPMYMLCQINTLDDSVCDNGYCYYRYISYNLYKNKHDKISGVCDFCEGTSVFYKGDKSFCCGMCMDKYNKCKTNKPLNRLFIDLKQYKSYKIKLNKTIKEADDMIKKINDEINFMMIK